MTAEIVIYHYNKERSKCIREELILKNVSENYKDYRKIIYLL